MRESKGRNINREGYERWEREAMRKARVETSTERDTSGGKEKQ